MPLYPLLTVADKNLLEGKRLYCLSRGEAPRMGLP